MRVLCCTPNCNKYSRAREVDEMFTSSVAVFFTEIIKAVICLGFVAHSETPRKLLPSLINQIIRQPGDTLKVCIPAMIYIVQNNLFYVAASHLDAATFMVSVTSQLKIFTAAIFTVIILRRSLYRSQWWVCISNFIYWSITSSAADIYKKRIGLYKSKAFCFAAVLTACCLSGFAGIYFEKILKGTTPVSLWMRNVQMGVFAIPSSFIAILLQVRIPNFIYLFKKDLYKLFV
uniref:UDP-galactose transporter n=1 Tax=Heterorhabditis bacteriophora TaxID=37862 RepID=A0A1I7X8D3_HETBA